MEDGIKKDLKNYKALDRINKSDEFDTFFKLQIRTAAAKMFEAFTGTGPKNWDEFCKIRGEVIAILYPIQEIRGSKAMIKQLEEQLESFYNKQI